LKSYAYVQKKKKMCHVSARRLSIYNFEGHQKIIFNTSKVTKKQRYTWDLSDKVCKLNPKP
jgi:hypothetical protein